MSASGESSIVNYEAGCPEVIALWELLCARADVLGARFSGGGFGGSVVGLVRADASAAELAADVGRAYAARCPGAARRFALELRASGPGLRW
jgi:galacturonokinase